MELPSACSHPGWSVLALVLGLLLWARRRRGWDPRKCPTDLTGKTVIVTGANSGEMGLGAWGARGRDATRGAGEMQDRGAGLWDPAWPRGLAATGPPSPAASLALEAQMAPGEAGSRSPGCAGCAPGASVPCPTLTTGHVLGDLLPAGILCPGAALPRQALGSSLSLDSVPSGLMTDSQGHPGAACPRGPPRCQPPPALPHLEAAPTRPPPHGTGLPQGHAWAR